VLAVPQYLGLKAEALHLADRTSEALEAITEAEALAEKFEQRAYLAELYRLRGVFLAATGSDETQIEAAFRESIRIAKQQKSISLMKRAEASCAEYRLRKLSTLRYPGNGLNSSRMSYADRITIEPGKCGGRPCIRGYRMRVKDVLELLAHGASWDEILADYSFLEREDIQACLDFAAAQSDHALIKVS
jgi:uncharacterized protein (DUF433 family)